MSLLEIHGLTHAFRENLLYKNVELTLNKGEHMGIVGPNGTGKSTLLKICTGQIIPDAGQVIWQPGISTGYLDQYAEINQTLTIENFLKTAFFKWYALEAEMIAIYEGIADKENASLERAAHIQSILETENFYSLDTHIERVANGLGLHAIGLDRPIKQVSGGQRTKIILAKLLLEKPDVLLFDEPTNFLDQEHIAWLAGYLSGLENAFMVVSHDFSFLDKTAACICDIDHGDIRKYYGAYSDFLQKKTLLRKDYVKQYTAQQKEIKKTEEFIRKNIAGRKSKMARGRQKQLERMEKIELPSQTESRPRFSFPALPSTNAEHLSVARLSIGYHYPLLSNLTFRINGGQKVVITGFNGIGKSTLLKTLMGKLPPLQGYYRFSAQVSPAYFAQDITWTDAGLTPLQVISAAHPQLSAKEARRHLARCGLSNKHVLQPVTHLSGGEQARVKLCLLTLTPCNFLILDEPTNHLDEQAKEALREALKTFPGTILLVSHEEAFYRGWAQKVIDAAKKF